MQKMHLSQVTCWNQGHPGSGRVPSVAPEKNLTRHPPLGGPATHLPWKPASWERWGERGFREMGWKGHVVPGRPEKSQVELSGSHNLGLGITAPAAL